MLRSIVITILAVLMVRAAPAAVPAAGAPDAPPAQFRTPYLPTDRNAVLQDVPASSDPQVVRMRQLKNVLAASPGDAQAAARLGGAYLDFGRRIGDAHYAGYADAVIAPWLKLERPPLPVLVLHGVTLQYQHQFQAARAELQRALARAPEDAQSWLTLSTIDMTQGEYAAARADCRHLMGRENLTVGLTCTAAVDSFTGQAERAQQVLASVDGQTAAAGASIGAWVLGLEAEVAGRRGDWARADAFFRTALQSAPDDDFLLVGYADFLLDRSRPVEVVGLLAGQAQSDTAFLRLALAQQALRSPQLARYTWLMAARFEALTLRGSALYDREHARFALHLLHDADGALELAQANWQQQRAPWDARVLLEAALAAGKPQAATEVLAMLDRTHLQDPVIESLAAAVRQQLPAQPRK